MAVVVPFFILMLVSSMSIPAEQIIVDQTKTSKMLYLPHVDEPLDQYHFWMEDQQGNRTFTTFCQTGLEPPWNEGQTITWMTFKVEPDCLRLLGYDGLRDKQHNIINR
jgi:hypothetical protein